MYDMSGDDLAGGYVRIPKCRNKEKHRHVVVCKYLADRWPNQNIVFFLYSFPFILVLIFAVYISQAYEAGT